MNSNTYLALVARSIAIWYLVSTSLLILLPTTQYTLKLYLRHYIAKYQRMQKSITSFTKMKNEKGVSKDVYWTQH